MSHPLADPKWTGISVISALVFGIVSLLVTPVVNRVWESKTHLSISRGVSVDAATNKEFREMTDLVRTFPNAKEDIFPNFMNLYSLENDGDKPITPSDFVQSIHLKCGGGCKIISIIPEKDNGDDREVFLLWGRHDDSDWELKPFLLNPGEKIKFLVLLYVAPEHQVGKPFDSNSVLRWEYRVLGLSEKSLLKPTIESVDASLQMQLFNHFFIRFSGTLVYLFVVTGLLMFLLLLYSFLNFSVYANGSPILKTLHISFLLGFAFSLSEIGFSIRTFDPQYLSKTCIWIPVVFLFYLGYLFADWKGLFKKTPFVWGRFVTLLKRVGKRRSS